MLFGKIDYINLLPFHIYLKKSNLSNSIKKSCEFKKSYPSNINKKFSRRLVDGAFISSVESNKKNIHALNLGIIAKKRVDSVLVKKNTANAHDPHSATSNVLAKVLEIDGEVYIGDKALKLYLESPDEYIDLAAQWYEKYQLPFVFARLCVTKNLKIYKKIAAQFGSKKVRIPQYILKKYANERKIPPKEILKYLTLISYQIGKKESNSLKIFLKKSNHFGKNSSFKKHNTQRV